MNLNSAIKLLKKHSDWLNGDHSIMTDTYHLIIAIDIVVKHYEKQERIKYINKKLEDDK